MQIYTNSVADVIEKILPFVDNMARATAVEVTSEDAKQLLEGIKLVERQFLEISITIHKLSLTFKMISRTTQSDLVSERSSFLLF